MSFIDSIYKTGLLKIILVWVLITSVSNQYLSYNECVKLGKTCKISQLIKFAERIVSTLSNFWMLTMKGIIPY